jgi:hypothetical protein
MELARAGKWMGSIQILESIGLDGRQRLFDLQRQVPLLAMFDFAREGRRSWQRSYEMECKSRVGIKRH